MPGKHWRKACSNAWPAAPRACWTRLAHGPGNCSPATPRPALALPIRIRPAACRIIFSFNTAAPTSAAGKASSPHSRCWPHSKPPAPCRWPRAWRKRPNCFGKSNRPASRHPCGMCSSPSVKWASCRGWMPGRRSAPSTKSPSLALAPWAAALPCALPTRVLRSPCLNSSLKRWTVACYRSATTTRSVSSAAS
ncbi:hypothetical protein D3C87_1466300 [compost metagenome]